MALAQTAARFASGSNGLGHLVREAQDLGHAWKQINKKLVEAIGAPTGKRDESVIATLRAELKRIEDRNAMITRRLDREFPEYVELSRPSPLSVAEVQALLDRDEALVQLAAGPNDESFAWLVTKTKTRWARIPLGSDALWEVRDTLDCGLDPSNWDNQNGRDYCRRLLGTEPTTNGPLPFNLRNAYEFYSALFGPFWRDLKQKRLLIAADGPLGSLPFGVLVTESPSEAIPKTANGYRDAKWLGVQSAITMLPAVSSLRALRKLSKANRAPELFIGFGDPALRGNPSCGKPSLPASCPGAPAGIGQRVASLFGTTATRSLHRALTRAPMQSLFKGNLADVDLLRDQCPLPETSFELKCVAQSLGVPESQIQVQEKATETAVKKAPLDRYQIVHFATHGLLASETKQATGSLVEPALLLTPPPTPTEADDGLLTASEIAQLKLNADWVVLSACNTAGAGDATSGEALSGLARAFFYAGARALLVSHWAVDSDAAVLLTTRAFVELRTDVSIGRAEALRRSMQAIIEDRSRSDGGHPSFWAPFVVVGEGAAR
jgi:CHAT domain-containing protein